MTKRMGLAVVGIVCLCTVALAMAPTKAPGMGPEQFPLVNSPLGRLISGSIGRLMVLRSDVALTDAQRQQVREVLVKHRAEIAATVKSVRDSRVELRNTVLRGDADEATIKAAADNFGQAVSAAAVKASKLRNELAPILTEEQKQRIGEFFSEQDAAVNKVLERAVQAK
ncbi:MAG: Spy/CpxP family protein refolding chaperone [Pirellulaceae bacterium]